MYKTTVCTIVSNAVVCYNLLLLIKHSHQSGEKVYINFQTAINIFLVAHIYLNVSIIVNCEHKIEKAKQVVSHLSKLKFIIYP